MRVHWLVQLIFGAVALGLLGVAGLLGYVFYQRHQYKLLTDIHDLKLRVDQMGARYVARRAQAALVIGVRQQGKEHVHGFGAISAAHLSAPDAHTVFEIGSVTKVFTAITLAELANDKQVNLDDPISVYLPKEVVLQQKESQTITLLHLATHTSGLPRLPGNFDTVSKDEQNPYANYKAADLYRDLSAVKLNCTPGAKSDYSNYGFGLLGHLLELKASQSYERLIERIICEPLGLRDTSIHLSAEQRARLIPGHNATGKVVSNWDFDALAPAGALRSTAADLLKFVQANLEPGDSPLGKALAEAQKTRFDAWSGTMGLGWQISKTIEDLKIFWHNGGTGGYVSFIGFDKVHQTGVVILSNYGDAFAGDNSVDEMGMEILKLASKVSWD